MSCMDVFLSFVVKVHSVSHVTTTVCVKPYALFDLLRCERCVGSSRHLSPAPRRAVLADLVAPGALRPVHSETRRAPAAFGSK